MKTFLYHINDWLAVRRWTAFWLSLPAVAAGILVALIALIILVNTRQSDQVDFQYQRRASAALAAGRYEVARVACLRRLAANLDESSRMQVIYQMGLALNGLGQKRAAIALLAHAAPLDQPGSLPAHLLMAQMLLSTSELTGNNLKFAEQHLLKALALDPQSPEVNELLGRYYINTHNPSKARERLKVIYPANTEAALLLAITYAQEKDYDTATLWADTAIAEFDRKIKNAAPQDSPSDRLGLARALMMEEKQGAAVAALEQGQRLGANADYAAAIAEDCASWADQLSTAQKADGPERLRVIQKGLDNAPQHLKLQLQLVQTAHAVDEVGLAAKTVLNRFMNSTNREITADWYFVLWTDARGRGDWSTARQQLWKAYDLAPQNPFICNDLAMDLATGSLADWERALKLIQATVEQFPENPQFRDTRGRIMARLSRNGEAADDLEFAVSKLAQPAETRMVLATVYDALGKPLLANEQRRLAAQTNNPAP